VHSKRGYIDPLQRGDKRLFNPMQKDRAGRETLFTKRCGSKNQNCLSNTGGRRGDGLFRGVSKASMVAGGKREQARVMNQGVKNNTHGPKIAKARLKRVGGK